MNNTNEDRIQGLVEELRRELSALGQSPLPEMPAPRRWRRGVLISLLAAMSLGIGTLGAVRSLFAQVPADVEMAEAPGSLEQPPYVPVKVGRYYVNIPAICYAYWAAPRSGESRSFVLDFGQGTRLILSEDEGRELAELFPDLRGEGPPPAQPDGRGFPAAPAP